MGQKANSLTRREVLKGIGASALVAASSRGAQAASYKQADSSWLAACRFGVSTHWTAQSQPVGADDWLPFEETVARFSPSSYLDQIATTGAQYVIFTSTHALQMLPAPSASIDRIAPGRTTKRDLIGELADACQSRGLHFILYYNHSCNSGDDPAWEHAVGYHAADKSRLAGNLIEIVRELGIRYGSRAEAWWFDSCFSLDPRGAYNSVTTDLHGFQFPWEKWIDAAKAGFDARLVALSSGMLTHFIYSTHQDYEGGEANDLVAVPSSRFTPDHLQGHRWVCLDNPGWVHSRVMTPLAAPRFHRDQVTDYVRTCNKSSVPVTFNVDIDRTGLLSSGSLELLRDVTKQLG
jgi:Alpha-L-fucosidase